MRSDDDVMWHFERQIFKFGRRTDAFTVFSKGNSVGSRRGVIPVHRLTVNPYLLRTFTGFTRLSVAGRYLLGGHLVVTDRMVPL